MEGAAWEEFLFLSYPAAWTTVEWGGPSGTDALPASEERTRTRRAAHFPGQHQVAAHPGENLPVQCLINQGCLFMRFYIKIRTYSETIPSNIIQKYTGLSVRKPGLQAELCPSSLCEPHPLWAPES